MNRKQIRGAAVMLVLMMLAAGCGGKTEKPAETSAAAEQTAETTAEGQSAESTPAGETSAEETTAEETTEPVPLVVTKHKEDGTHMVTAGALTISVPVKYKDGFGSIRITVKNNTEYDMAVRECTIIGVEVGSTEPDPELTLFGIPMGATRQEIADVYGEPFSKTFDDENHLSNMVYQFGTDIHSNQVVMIIFRDKKAVAASYEDFSLVRR